MGKRRAQHDLSISMGLQDDFSPELKTATSSAKKATDELTKNDTKLSGSSDKVTKALKAKINATKQVDFAVRKQMGATDQLEGQLAELEEEYERLVVVMRAMARSGEQIPKGMIRQASAAREAATALREQKASAEEANRTFDKFKLTGIAATAWAMSMMELGRAIDAVRQEVSASIKPLQDLHGEWSLLDKVLGSVKETIDDPAFAQLNKIEQGMVLVYRSLNTELAEVAAKHKQQKDIAQSRALDRAAEMSQIDAEIAQERNAAAQRAENAKRLAAIEKQSQDRRQRRLADLRKEREIQQRNREAATMAAQQYADMEASKAEAYRKARQQERAASLRIETAEQDMILAGQEWREERMKEAAKRNAEAARQTQAAWQNASSVMGAAMGQAFANMILDSKNAHKHLLTGIVDAAASAIQVYAIQAAAGAAASSALLSPFAMAFASAAALSLVRGLIALLPSFNQGGVVPGTDTGRDSVAIAARPGERVLTVEQTEQFDRMVSALEAGGAGAGGVHLHQHSAIPPNSAQTLRQVRAVRKLERRLQRLGMA